MWSVDGQTVSFVRQTGRELKNGGRNGKELEG